MTVEGGDEGFPTLGEGGDAGLEGLDVRAEVVGYAGRVWRIWSLMGLGRYLKRRRVRARVGCTIVLLAVV